jgi:cation transport ATPase
MDTLISLGTLAAWAWSIVALYAGDAGMTGMRMSFTLLADRSGALEDVYFEVAAAVVTFVLAGRFFEARAKRRAGAALEALLALGAKDVAVLEADGAAAELERAVEDAEALGRTAVVAAWDGRARAVLVVADTPKQSAPEAIRQLRALGLRPVLLTGDNERTARAVAAQVGIDEAIAEVLPAEKADVVRRLQQDDRVVAMVGDGVNDAPALAQADLGLAIGTGTDVAIEASDLTLVSGDLRAAADAIRLSRATLRTIKQNLAWAFGYNVAVIPLAAAGLLNPLLAGAAMACCAGCRARSTTRLEHSVTADVGCCGPANAGVQMRMGATVGWAVRSKGRMWRRQQARSGVSWPSCAGSRCTATCLRSSSSRPSRRGTSRRRRSTTRSRGWSARA